MPNVRHPQPIIAPPIRLQATPTPTSHCHDCWARQVGRCWRCRSAPRSRYAVEETCGEGVCTSAGPLAGPRVEGPSDPPQPPHEANLRDRSAPRPLGVVRVGHKRSTLPPPIPAGLEGPQLALLPRCAGGGLFPGARAGRGQRVRHRTQPPARELRGGRWVPRPTRPRRAGCRDQPALAFVPAHPDSHTRRKNRRSGSALRSPPPSPLNSHTLLSPTHHATSAPPCCSRRVARHTRCCVDVDCVVVCCSTCDCPTCGCPPPCSLFAASPGSRSLWRHRRRRRLCRRSCRRPVFPVGRRPPPSCPPRRLRRAAARR